MEKDWKDTLSALRSTVPISEEENLTDNSENTGNTKAQQSALHILTDKKGRNGKIATIIEGFTIDKNEIDDIARQIKQKLGVGGSVRDSEILIQGDHKEKIKEYLKSLDFNIK